MSPVFGLFEVFSWWAGLTGAQQFFYAIGILAGVATLIMAVLSVVGLDHHELGTEAVDLMEGSSLLSTKPITGFFLGFGWAGGIALQSGMNLGMASLVAVATGGVLMVVLAWLIRAIYSLRTDGTRRISDAVGAVGTVYVTLPASRVSGGQINVTVSGRLETLPALNAALQPIPSGEKVKVVAVVDTNTVLVEPMG